ncbi:permease [Paraliobacillus quinghaiensis]|uniref:Permease n=1 Tax=Paraliobacillus quinghaiensis TaxID=470815 RepID=A0A917WWQ9_9BACI|nr:permease [Paraliobacillus quinghaiensis]
MIIYAGNILIGKAINELAPFTITFFRLLIAFIVVLPIGFRSAWRNRSLFWKYKKPFTIMSLTGVTFFNTFIYGALQFTSASNVSVLETVIPVITIVLSAWILKERLRVIQWFGVMLSIIGALWVVLDGAILELATINWNIGDFIMIGAILSWAFYSVFVKQYMHLFPPFAALLVMTSISLVVLFPIMLTEWIFYGIPSIFELEYVTSLLYLGVFPSLIALLLYNNAVHKLGASTAAIFLNFLPVVTMVGAYFWLGESITLMQIVGALFVIVGVVITTQRNLLKKDKILAPFVKEQ